MTTDCSHLSKQQKRSRKMLNKKEALVAAKRAENYPPGYGYNWGTTEEFAATDDRIEWSKINLEHG